MRLIRLVPIRPVWQQEETQHNQSAVFSIPIPIDESQYSGKFVLRLPKSLHARLAVEAEKEGGFT